MNYTQNRVGRHNIATLVLLVLVPLTWVGGMPSAARADDDFPKVIEGQAILEHPAGKVILDAAKLLREGKLAEVKTKSVKDVRDEWATLSLSEREDEIARNTERAPEPDAFEAQIAEKGRLTIYGESATLLIETPEGDAAAMAFVSLEGGQWKVTGGPMTFEPPPVETEPAIFGAEILEHPIGVLVLEYAERLAGGKPESALQLLSGEAQAARAALPAEERQQSDDFRRRQVPSASTFSDQISTGGQLNFYGDKAYLNVVTHETALNDDGSTTFTSNTTGLSFALENGEWRIGD